MSVGLEFSRVLFRSHVEDWTLDHVLDFVRTYGKDSETLNAIYVIDEHSHRSEERRVGKEGRCRWDWSSAVCSSDLTWRTGLWTTCWISCAPTARTAKRSMPSMSSMNTV